MADEWIPKPDPFGGLEPPRRNPPTAIGLATPPPPNAPRYQDRRAMRRRRMASAFAGGVLVASATTLATVGTVWSALVSAGLGALGGALLYRAIRSVQLPGALSASGIARLRARFSSGRRRAA